VIEGVDIANPDAAANALLAASLALSATAVALSGFCMAFVAKEVRTWWNLRHGPVDPSGK
jgi:hypothetical protein